ncbi:MAG: FAD-binding oxidoreductase, partial [Dehalococcoidia bacterium]
MVDLQVTMTTGRDTTIAEATIEEFKKSLRGELLSPGEAGYDEAREIWNAMIDRRPGLIVRCAGVSDVINSVNFARENSLLVAVRGGGHNVAGNAVCDGGIMIDLSLMKGMRVDPLNRTARAEPGLTWGEFDHETQAFGLATPGGQITTTGIAGVTLGGGWGWLSRKHGLASDNLMSADIVTADGKFLTASATENPDLFWGLRGGGGNFGIVTSFEYQLHAISTMLAGMVVHPFDRAKEVLEFYREFTRDMPDELACHAALMSSPDGDPIAVLVACYSGPVGEGERVLQPLREFGPPLADLIRPMAYTEVQTLLDDPYPAGLYDYWKSNFMTEISDDAIDTLVAHCGNRPSPMCHGLIEGILGGAVSRVNEDEIAFNHRNVVYSFLSLGVTADPAESDKCVQWAREFWDAMQPYSNGGVYVNYLGQEADEGVDRVKAAYGPTKHERLVALKNKYDPTNLFRLNRN